MGSTGNGNIFFGRSRLQTPSVFVWLFLLFSHFCFLRVKAGSLPGFGGRVCFSPVLGRLFCLALGGSIKSRVFSFEWGAGAWYGGVRKKWVRAAAGKFRPWVVGAPIFPTTIIRPICGCGPTRASNAAYSNSPARNHRLASLLALHALPAPREVCPAEGCDFFGPWRRRRESSGPEAAGAIRRQAMRLVARRKSPSRDAIR